MPSPEATPPALPLTAVCDLADVNAFSHCGFQPHVPVLAAFGAGRLHKYHTPGLWDLEAAVASTPAETLFRSVRAVDPESKLSRWEALTFRLGPHAFLYVDATDLTGYADTAAGAQRLVEDFAAKHAKAAPSAGGSFFLIKTDGREIDTEPVPLEAETLLAPGLFALHYGEEGATWHRGFTEKLRAARWGLCILEGSPGTGKTSYLRHLTGELKDTHRFYFIPPASLEVLSSPDFIGFWAGERRHHAERQFVVILEDADAALMPRAADNRSQVSAILNFSDGMLADFLRLEVICTVNARALDLDPALLRPGRLLRHRRFGRMEAARTRRLAEHLGRNLPAGEDSSLAEVYAGGDRDSGAAPRRPRLGFTA